MNTAALGTLWQAAVFFLFCVNPYVIFSWWIQNVKLKAAEQVDYPDLALTCTSMSKSISGSTIFGE